MLRQRQIRQSQDHGVRIVAQKAPSFLPHFGRHTRLRFGIEQCFEKIARVEDGSGTFVGRGHARHRCIGNARCPRMLEAR